MIPLFALAFTAALVGYFVLRNVFHRQAERAYQRQAYATARRIYDRLIRLYPRDAAARHGRSRVQIHQNDYHAALRDLNAAIRLYPRDLSLRLERAMLYTWLDEVSRARDAYDTLQQIYPDTPEVYLHRAWFHIRQGEMEAAHSELDEAESRVGTPAQAESTVAESQRRSQQITARSLRGAIYVQAGRYEDALATYSEALELAPSHAAIYNDLGEAHFVMGHYETALTYYNQAATLLESDASPAADSDTAMKCFVRAGQATAHHALGNRAEAQRLWQTLMQDNPSFADTAWVRNALNWTDPLVQEAGHIIDALNQRQQPVESVVM